MTEWDMLKHRGSRLLRSVRWKYSPPVRRATVSGTLRRKLIGDEDGGHPAVDDVADQLDCATELDGLIDALSPGMLHILCGTISMALGERLNVEHANRGIDFVGAPVFGRASDAEEGRLWVIAAGADKAVARARPLLQAFSLGITVVGKEPQQAFAMKRGAFFPPTS